MKVRLGFAVAAHTDPEILLMDETFAVGDEAFQEKCYAKIGEFQKAGKTLLFVSHDMEAVRRVADRALWLHEARITEDGTVEQVIDAYHATLQI
jgi:ABC-type polysaccharide/polyol phosphate transport system ATPase subunit